MTSTGLVLLPLFAIVIALAPRPWLLVVLLVAVGFDDGSIANPAGRTVPVGWFFALLIVSRVFWAILIRERFLSLDIVCRLFPLSAFVLSCVVSLLLAQALFQGEITVLPGSAKLVADLAAPYHLQPENLNQLFYIFLIVFLVYAVADIVAGLGPTVAAHCIDRAMRWSCAFVSVVVAWHIMNLVSGLWFPANFFHSTSYSGAWNQGVAGVRRPSGSYMEPSTLSYAFSMYLFYFWRRFRLTGKVVDQLWMLVALTVLLLSTATTAYASIAVFGVFATAAFIFKFFSSMRRVTSGSTVDVDFQQSEHKISLYHLIPMVVIFLFIGLAIWLGVQSADIIYRIFSEQILNKSQSESYGVRHHADVMAWSIFVDTWGLGLGLGSHRPSSGLLTILVGPGIVGTVLFFGFAFSVLWRPMIVSSAGADAARLADPIRWGTFGLLMCHAISAPEIQEVLLWTCFGLIVGITVPTVPIVKGLVDTDIDLGDRLQLHIESSRDEQLLPRQVQQNTQALRLDR